MTVATKKPKTPAKTKTQAAERIVVHEKVRTELRMGDKAITAAFARKLLGWTEEEPQTDSSPGTKFGGDYLLTDYNRKKIRCTNNVTNRPLYTTSVDSLRSEILNRRWRFNGEPVIVGRTDLLLNGQHQLVALVLATQEWADKPHWKDVWETEPTIDKLVVYGVDEGDETVNTMDTCKPRSLDDVIYRSIYFAKLESGKRRTAAKMTSYAIRTLWERTGVDNMPFAPKKTHAEFLDFLGRHERLLKAVKHLLEENSEGVLNEYLSPGYAAALMYLMATAESDTDRYRTADTRSEKLLDWSWWDKAEEFWTLMVTGTDFKPVRQALGTLGETENADLGGNRHERLAIVVKAWQVFAEGGVPTAKDVQLSYHTNDNGVKLLTDNPTCGIGVRGIDLGNPKSDAHGATELTAPPEGPEVDDLPPEEVEANAEEVRRNNGHIPVSDEEEKAMRKGSKRPSPRPKPLPKQSEPAPVSETEEETVNPHDQPEVAAQVFDQLEQSKPTEETPAPAPAPRKRPIARKS